APGADVGGLVCRRVVRRFCRAARDGLVAVFCRGGASATSGQRRGGGNGEGADKNGHSHGPVSSVGIGRYRQTASRSRAVALIRAPLGASVQNSRLDV